MVKHVPTMRETWVRSLGQEDPLEKEMATHSSILAWKIPWTEDPDRLQSMGSQRVRHDWETSLTHSLIITYNYKIQPVHSKGDQSWVFIGRTDAKAETPILWPPHVKSWLIGKDSDAGRDWGQEEKGTTGWDGWMASPTRWTWVSVNSGSWWWTGRSGVLWFGHDWVTELNCN